MIQLEKYTKNFEEEYWEAVNKRITSPIQDKLVESWSSYLPQMFFKSRGRDAFKELVLADYHKLQSIQEYIRRNTRTQMEQVCFTSVIENGKHIMKLNHPYDILYNTFEQVADSQKNKTSMRVRIVRHAGVTVCPYCNRDYINCRAENVSGAQLDHFFGRAEYPLFSLCLYNLVPSCGNCNRVKGKKQVLMVSPFDTGIDWENEITFSYSPKTLDSIEIIIETSDKLKNNIKEMKIEEAYEINDAEVKELLNKTRMYSETQRQEFQDVLPMVNLTDMDIKQAIFGPQITAEAMKKKPLGKMMRDLHKELGIY